MFAKTIKVLCASLSLSAVMFIHAEEQRDYYGEPGLNAFKQSLGHTDIEAIDPFSGIVQLQQTDLVVPGNGGLDISIHRSYTTPQVDFGKDWFNVLGSGWVMHYGRITIPAAYANTMCPDGFFVPSFDTTRDNPSLERPDGGRELLISDTDGGDYDGLYKTKSKWKAECISGSAGLKVTSPNGTIYWMNQQSMAYDAETERQEISWYTSKVQDVSGNILNISYVQFDSTMQYIKEINANDGRKVVFEYMDVSALAPANQLTKNAVVSTISSEGQVWTYQYSTVWEDVYTDGTAFRILALSTVTPPAGAAWQYTYQIHQGTESWFAPRALLLDTVTYPYGGVVDYDYQSIDFYQEYVLQDLNKWVIAKKQTSGPNVTPGAWLYQFEPASVPYSNFTGLADKTTIVKPDGSKEEYTHYGYDIVESQDAWRIGLLINKRVTDESGSSKSLESYTWGKLQLSTENYTYTKLNGSWKLDDAVYASFLKEKWVSSDGTVASGGYTTQYLNQDEFGQPQQIVEMVNSAYSDEVSQEGGANRTTNIQYDNDKTQWIIGLPVSEEIVGVGTATKTYTATGKVASENKYGIVTQYEYYPDGDLYRVIDAKGNATTYSDYKRGQAQTINYPESILTTRVITNRATLSSETNGRTFTKSYQWDDLNRLTHISFAEGSPVDITWANNSTVLVRGNYREEKLFDGFGHVYTIKRKDLATGEEIITNTEFDAEGKVLFKGMPYKSGGIEKGINYEYDALGRVIKETYEDGTFTAYEYPKVDTEIVTDARGNSIQYKYRFYGSPENDRTLMKMEQNKTQHVDGDVISQFHKNKLNQTTKIFQGQYFAASSGYLGRSRMFDFNLSKLLEKETHPESKPILYTYDAVGNLETKTYEGLPSITYTYDGLNRLRNITFANGQAGYYMEYNENNNILSVSNDNTSRGYIYDGNDNLEQEQIVIADKNYNISYSYNDSDFIQSITYPSGRVVNFNPDAFGRATQASPYVSNIVTEASGNLKSYKFSNNKISQFTYTDRGWLDSLIVDNLVSLDYGYDSVGNIQAINDAITPVNNRTMIYDDLDRLKEANGSWGSAVYAYDAFGNITGKSIGSNIVDSYQYAGAENRLSEIDRLNSYYNKTNYGYNDKGELISKNNMRTLSYIDINDSYDYTYDNQGNMLTAKKIRYSDNQQVSQENFSFLYDAQNNRVQRVAKGNTKQFIFSNNGLMLGEYLISPSIGSELIGKEHVYLHGKKVASVTMNKAPSVNAGIDKTVNEGQSINLIGAATDIDGIIKTYHWEQTGGPVVQLAAINSSTLAFTAPIVEQDTVLTFTLMASDDVGESGSDSIDVLVKDILPPVAIISTSQTTFYSSFDGGGGSVSLSGISSYDYLGMPLTYRWSQVSGSPLTLGSVNNSSVNFMAENGNYTIQLDVTNSSNLTGTAMHSFEVKSYLSNEDNVPDSIPDGWEAFYFGDANLYDDNSDPDNDLLTNAVEYSIGSDPKQFDIVFTDSVKNVKAIPSDGYNLIKWDALPGANTYNIYWTDQVEFNKATANKITNATQPYVHGDLINGNVYKYLVVGVNDTGESLDSTIVSSMPKERSVDSRPVSNDVDNKGISISVYRDREANLIFSVFGSYYDANTGYSSPVAPLENFNSANGRNEVRDIVVRFCGNKYVVAWIQYAPLNSTYSSNDSYVVVTSFFNVDTKTWQGPNVLDTPSSTRDDDESRDLKVECNQHGQVIVGWLRSFWDYSGTSSVLAQRLLVSNGIQTASLDNTNIDDVVAGETVTGFNIEVGESASSGHLISWRKATLNTRTIKYTAGVNSAGSLFSQSGSNALYVPQVLPLSSSVSSVPAIAISRQGNTFIGYRDSSVYKSYEGTLNNLFPQQFSTSQIISSSEAHFDRLGKINLYSTGSKVTGTGKSAITTYFLASHKISGGVISGSKEMFQDAADFHLTGALYNEVDDVSLFSKSLTASVYDYSKITHLTGRETPSPSLSALPDPEIISPQQAVHFSLPTKVNVSGSYPIENITITIPGYGSAVVKNGFWQIPLSLTATNYTYNLTLKATDGYRNSNNITLPPITEGVVSPTVTNPTTVTSTQEISYLISGTHPRDGVTIELYRTTDYYARTIASGVVSNGQWSIVAPLLANQANYLAVRAYLSADGVTRTSPNVRVSDIYQGAAIMPPVVTTPSSALIINQAEYSIAGTHGVEGAFVNLYVDANNDGYADNSTILGTAIVAGGQWSISVQMALQYSYSGYAQDFHYVVKAVNGSNTTSATKVPTITVQVVLPVASTTITKTTSKGYTFFNVGIASNKPGKVYYRFVSGGGTITSGQGVSDPDAYSGYLLYTGPLTIKTKSTTDRIDFYASDNNGWKSAAQSVTLQ